MNYVIASIYQTESSCDAAFVVCELLSYFMVKNTSYFLNDKIVTVRAIKGAHERPFLELNIYVSTSLSVLVYKYSRLSVLSSYQYRVS